MAVCETYSYCRCGKKATRQCGYPIIRRETGQRSTCGKPLCSRCATPVDDVPSAGGRVYCPPHEKFSRLPKVNR